MNRLPDIGQVSDLRLGDHPGFDAWFYSFCAENNIEHGINPSGVASPEQLRFMVAMDERQVYAPCSDATFRELAASFHLRSFPPRVRSQYIAAWRSIIRVVRYEKDRQKRRDMINYCRHRFRGGGGRGRGRVQKNKPTPTQPKYTQRAWMPCMIAWSFSSTSAALQLRCIAF